MAKINPLLAKNDTRPALLPPQMSQRVHKVAHDKSGHVVKRHLLPVFGRALSLKRAWGVLKGAQKPPLTGIRNGPLARFSILRFEHLPIRYVAGS